MRRRHRILLSLSALAGSVALVLGLTGLGAAAEGPFSTVLRGLSSSVIRLESAAMYAVRGPGRSAEMDWLRVLRTNADSLARPDALLFGAYATGPADPLAEVIALEQRLGTTLPLIQLYTAWGDEPEHRFPRRQVETIAELGSIPVVTWEPWLTPFENRLHPHLPLRASRDRGGLAAVARGDYDFYIDQWAQEAAHFGRPLLLRFAHEMNDPYRYPWGPQHNEPQEFVAAWRRVVERFRAAGAENVLWIWSPHVAYEGYERYWPGDEYVDWVATGALNYGTVAYWSQWWSFDEIFGRHYDFLAGFGKPLMVAEFGTLAVGGDRAAWYHDALRDLATRYPQVRALLLFHVANDQTVTRQSLDWTLGADTVTLQAVREGLRAEE